MTPKQAPPAIPPKSRATTRCVGLRAKGISTQPSCKNPVEIFHIYFTFIVTINVYLPQMVLSTRASLVFYQFYRPTTRITHCQSCRPDKGWRPHCPGPVKSAVPSPVDCPQRPAPESSKMASRSMLQMIWWQY